MGDNGSRIPIILDDALICCAVSSSANDRFTDAVDKAAVSDRARVPFEAGILVDKRVHASQ